MSEPSREQQLQAILHAYLQAVDAGQKPDREELLRQHPDFTEESHAFFADQQQMDQLAQSLQRRHGLERHDHVVAERCHRAWSSWRGPRAVACRAQRLQQG